MIPINDLGCGWVLAIAIGVWGFVRFAELVFLHSQKMQELKDRRDVALVEAQYKSKEGVK